MRGYIFFVLAGMGVAGGAALAQGQTPQGRPAGERHFPSAYTPLAVEQPQPSAFTPATPSVYAGSKISGIRPQAAEPARINPEAGAVRLAAAERVVAAPGEEAPLRLAPRGEQARGAAGPVQAAPNLSGTLGTVASSLAVVLGILFVVVWYARRFAPAGSKPLPTEAVELLGRAPLAGRQQVQLVRVGQKLLLLALSPTEVTTLTEIADPAEVEHLLGLCRRSLPGSSSAAFRQALDQIGSEPAAGGFVGAGVTSSRGVR